jgi:hypothetical protein
MRIRIYEVTATALLLTALAGCGGGAEPETIRVTTTKTVTPGVEAPASDEAKARSSVAAMGDVRKFSFEGDDEYDPMAGNVTVLSYEQPVYASVTAAEEVGDKGYVWAALEVKICATKGEFTTSSMPWTLAYDDGTRVEPSSVSYDDFPKPAYVEDASVVAGDCSRGKIVFPVPGKQHPSKAIYSTENSPTLRWSLSKQH